MAIGVGQTSKGRTASGTSQATTGVTTQASGSTFVLFAVWDTGNFSSIADSKGNTYTQIQTELAWGIGTGKMRMYYCANGTGGASHTATLTVSTNSPIFIGFVEITGAAAASFDLGNRQTDPSSPYTSPAISTTQAAELLVSCIGTDSGSNPATFAESTGFTVQAAATETNGASFYTCAMATRIVAATSSYSSSFTDTGAVNAGVYIAGFKEGVADVLFGQVLT